MMQVVQQADGKFAVRDSSSRSLNDVVGVFTTQREADEWMLGQSMAREQSGSGLNLQMPGGGQRLD